MLIVKRMGQVWCGLAGHHLLLRYEPERLSLECAHCGYESPGWALSTNRDGHSARRAKAPATGSTRAVVDLLRPARV